MGDKSEQTSGGISIAGFGVRFLAGPCSGLPPGEHWVPWVSWSHVWRRVTGQLNVEDVDD
jgi:hypothetical protein